MTNTSIEKPVTRILISQKAGHDPRSAGFLTDAHALGLTQIRSITCKDLYFLQGDLSAADLERLALQVLHDPITQTIVWARWNASAESDTMEEHGEDGKVIEGCLRSGVTDPVAEQILRAAHTLKLSNLSAVSTGQRFIIQGTDLNNDLLHSLATRLLFNGVIQRYGLGTIHPGFPVAAQSGSAVEIICLRGQSDETLLQISQERRAALNLEEMQAIQAYCEREQRDLTDVEFEMIAQTWSEHCVHKTFKAHITLAGDQPQEIDNLFNRTIRDATRQIGATWVRSAFVDNAGIIDYDGKHELSFKVETHNHPSAIEPFGGANTGTGGVIRDVVGVSARPIASTDILCFGPANTPFENLPAGVLHPRRVASGVIRGIEDYGNKTGIPTVNGAVWYDPGYISNPLVYCGCVGIAPLDSHPREPQPGDRVIVIGGRTGRDGLRGATFSSMTMDATTGEVAGSSVQIGAPIVEKGVIDVTMAARDRRLYHAITDCGAGGLSSAVGEMASTCGAQVQLEKVPLKYPGLTPWEIWLSEAQERMVLAISPSALAEMQQLCNLYEVELTDIGAFNASGRMTARYQDQIVLDLDNEFLHHGVPQRRLTAILPKPARAAGELDTQPDSAGLDFNTLLTRLLSHPNIASKERVVRVYDHEVQGATLLKPMTGVMNDGPSDACVLRPMETQGDFAFALSAAINPEYGKSDPGQMAANTIDEAIRNAVAVGANPDQLAILDNFCWGNPNRPATLGGLVAAALACRDTAIAYGTPFISGKDSFNNEYLGMDGQRHAIPPSLLISAMGVITDWHTVISMDLKQPGNRIYRIGPFNPTLGGSHFNLIHASPITDGVPGLKPQQALEHYRAFYRCAQAKLVSASHDLSEGGLAVAAAEMCIGGRLGMELDLSAPDSLRACFGESTGCLLVEINPEQAPSFEALFAGLQCDYLGTVTAAPQLTIKHQGTVLIQVSVNDLLKAWQGKI